jgi:triacylglycerol lipase
MLARIQQVIVLALLLAQAIAMALAIVLGHPSLHALVPVVAVAAYVAVLAAEFWILRSSYAAADPLRPRLGALISACTGEIFAAPRAFLWRQPFFERAITDNVAGTRRGVVFVHGFFCNRALWNPWLRRLKRAQVPFVAVSLEPVLGSIDDYCDTIGAAVETLRRATSLAPVIVAHSMGGLAVRAWFAIRSDATAVHRIVTIASPHAGTRMARRSVARNIGEMRIGSDWLADLGSRETPSAHARFICFWSHCDNIVFPTRTATLPQADNRHLAATAHVQMALHPAIFETVLELLA